MNAQPYAPTISTPSLLSTSDIPAVNSAGNTRIDQTDKPLDASAAEIPSTPISVAVSKPSPNRDPSGYICQLQTARSQSNDQRGGKHVEWPSEQKRPTVIGRLPSCIK